MKNKSSILRRAMLLACLGLWVPGLGAGEVKEAEADKTLSPYFFVKSDNSQVDQLPLKSTRSDVTISGIIADVRVTQVYKNEGKNTLEAIYVFPASTRAAVYAMKMTIGERTLVANIQEKQKAREQYEQALAEGKTASLLEQQRPNVFQMNVGNILPGDEIQVELKYTEALVPEAGVYEFVYPTVVGPRYSNQPAAAAPASEKWVANPYLHSGEVAPFTFAFTLSLHAGLPIAKLTSPSHELDVRYDGASDAQVALKDNVAGNNRDVVIRYALAGDQIESGMLLHQGQKENYFLLMLEPPKRVATKSIVPREYIFVVDVSGSMHGFPLDTTKALMKNLLGSLRPTDFFNVMTFSGDNAVLAPHSLSATQANLQKAIAVIDQEQGGGGTELMPALRAAMALPRAEENISRSMIVVTDGYVSVEKDALTYIRKNLNRGNVFAFGIGSSVNRYLIEGMAHAGMGEPFIVLNPEQAAGKAQAFKTYVESPVLTDIQVAFKGFQAYDVEPVAIPDLFAEKPVMVFGKYRGAAAGRAVITGKTSESDYRREIEIHGGQAADNPALRYLWARQRIRMLSDMNQLESSDPLVREVTQLGLEYNLLTDYTSFVAVDSLRRADGKNRTTVNQPLPLPQGVSDLAVGGSAQGFSGMPAMACKRRACESYAPAPYTANGSARDDSESVADEKAAAIAQTAAVQLDMVVSILTGQIVPAGAEQILAKFKAGWFHLIQAAAKTGELVLKLHVNAQGQVAKVEVVSDSLNLQGLVDRITRDTRRIVFPQGKNGDVVQLVIRSK
jgi:Ca-activated chloride channel homolog